MPKNLVLCCDGTWNSADQGKDPVKTGEDLRHATF